jgi:predicted GNAT family N-acyltransferase
MSNANLSHAFLVKGGESPPKVSSCTHMAITTKEYAVDSAEYRQELDLRNRVLRVPLGLVLSQKDREHDDSYIHFGAFDGDCLVASMALAPVNAEIIKMKQVAVETQQQGRGIGTILVKEAERLVSSRKYSRIELHAREVAVPFYKKLGYSIDGPLFYEVGIPHYFMYKHLSLHP